jgi:cell division protein FtsQ
MKRICIQLDSRILVNLGDLQDLDYRMAFLKEILLEKLNKNDKGTLNFTTGESPEFIPDK